MSESDGALDKYERVADLRTKNFLLRLIDIKADQQRYQERRDFNDVKYLQRSWLRSNFHYLRHRNFHCLTP